VLRLGAADAGRCRRRIHLEHDPAADRSLRRPPEPGLQLRLADLAAHREVVHDRLASTIELVEDWDPAGADRPAAVWAPRLASATRIATPDLLLRAPDGGYLPVLVRGHRTLDPGTGAPCSDLDLALPGLLAPVPSAARKARSHHADALALAHVYRTLGELGLASGDARGGIIGKGGPAADADWDDGALILWHRLGPGGAVTGENATTDQPATPALAEYDARFADRLAVARAAATGQPALAQPSRVAECRRCPWWPVCEPELQASRDVSLLVAGSDVDVLHDAGVVTYDDLAALDPRIAAALPLTGIPAADARARALALIAGAPLVRRTARVDPRRADVELDVDMESYLDDGAYLWGTYLTTAGDTAPPPGFAPGYRPFVTWLPLNSPTAAENFVAFWRYLTQLRQACSAAGRTFAAYCYSRKAEERWLYGTPQRFPHVAGMPTRSEVDRFCSSGQWVDLYAEIKRCFVVPGSLRLKKVAEVAGFGWRDPEPSGENSMAWYRIATSGDGSDARAHRSRILRYNEDDVRATLALRHWMTDRSHEMPTVADLDTYRGGMRSAPSNRMTSPLR